MALGEHIDGWMLPDELAWLYDRAALMGSVLEIGSWLGRSTFALCSSGCRGVWAVDTFDRYTAEEYAPQPSFEVPPFLQFFRNVGHFRNLHIVPFSSAEAARTLEGAFDFVFIDGSHRYEDVRRDLELWEPRAKVLLAGHDFELSGVRRAVTERFGEGGFTREVGSIWARRVAGS